MNEHMGTIEMDKLKRKTNCMNEKFLLITFYITAFIFAMWLLTMIPK